MNLKNMLRERKKTHSKDHILYNSIYVTFQKRQNYNRKWISGCQGLGRGKRLTTKKHKGNSGVTETFQILTVTLLSTSIKTHKTAHLQWVNFLCVYLSKPYFNYNRIYIHCRKLGKYKTPQKNRVTQSTEAYPFDICYNRTGITLLVFYSVFLKFKF